MSVSDKTRNASSNSQVTASSDSSINEAHSPANQTPAHALPPDPLMIVPGGGVLGGASRTRLRVTGQAPCMHACVGGGGGVVVISYLDGGEHVLVTDMDGCGWIGFGPMGAARSMDVEW